MPCKNLRGQLSLYASGDLDDAQAQGVRDHLRTCPTCRNGVESFEKTRSLLGSYRQQIPSPPNGQNLWNGVMGRMTQKLTRGKAQPPPQG
jgi:anti-sigma factor RsiW